MVSFAFSSSGEYDTTIFIEPQYSTTLLEGIHIKQGQFQLRGKPSHLNKVSDEWLEKSNTFDITLHKDSFKTEDDEESTVDYLHRITSFQKPITLWWIRSTELGDLHDEQTVRALLEKHHIDTTNILVKDSDDSFYSNDSDDSDDSVDSDD